jgi:peptidyl-prolyl cis-trans isomerase C
MKKILREPLLHFIIIGAFLFLLSGWVDSKRKQANQQIAIDTNVVERMTNQYQQQMGKPLGEDGLNAMINQYIQNEIYYREALKLGLENDDEIIRRRLSQKYVFLLIDNTIPKTPSDEELKKYYSNNLSLFRDSGRLTFTHIYFSPDIDGIDGAKKRAEQAYKKINASNIEVASQIGDSFLLEKRYTNATQMDVKRNFGDSAFTDSIFKMPLHHWSHPIESGYGWHLIYVENINQAVEAPFELIKNEVLKSWQNADLQQQEAKNNKELLSQYTVVRTYTKEK